MIEKSDHINGSLQPSGELGRAGMISERSHAIDILKVIAIIGVLIIHSCSGGYSYGVGTFNWSSAVFWGSLARASVPIFLMCSGALLLNPEKELPLRKLYLKNLLRIVIALFFWAMAYKVFGLVMSRAFTIQNMLHSIKEIILFRHESHLYYLHIIILVYVFLPVTRILTRNATRKELQYLIILWFILGILYPTAKHFWPFTLLSGIPSQWLMNMTYASIGYGILGFYLQKYAMIKKEIYFLLLGIGFTGVFVGTWIMSVEQGSLYEVFLEGMSPFVALMAVGIFGLVTCYTKPGSKGSSFITRIANASFCIYLVHIFLIYIFNSIGLTVSILPSLISIPFLAGINFLCSYIVYLLLSHIPIAKKYIV